MEVAKASFKPSEIDLLFQETRNYCRQHDRDSVQHGLWHADVEAKIVETEASLHAAQARNARLSCRAKHLQRVLETTRAQYAYQVADQFFSKEVAKCNQNDTSRDSRRGNHSSSDDVCHTNEAALLNGADVESGSPRKWHDFEARVPKSRKQSVRSTLIEKLKSAGVDIPERDFDDRISHARPDTSSDLGHCSDADTNSEFAILRLLRSYCTSDDEGTASDTGEMDLGTALLAAFSDSSRLRSSKSVQGHDNNEWGQLSGKPWEDALAGYCKLSGILQIETDGPWRYEACLRSHLDGVRSVLIIDDVLLSCGEDTTVKAWDVAFLKKGNSQVGLEDLESYATYRGHVSSALCLACTQCSAQEQVFFSGGQDATICAWQLLAPTTYDAYEPSPSGQRPTVCLHRFTGHTDAVWSLALHPHSSVLASAAADGTVRLWDAEAKAERAPMMRVLESPLHDEKHSAGNVEHDQATGVAWVVHQTARLLAGFSSSRRAVFDVQHNSVVLEKHGTKEQSVTSIACLPMTDLAVSGHTDRVARLFSLSTGSVVSEFSGHDDVVTSVAADPSGGYEVVTSCHDGCVRIFDVRTGKCLQQSRLHQRKFEESMHCVHHSGQHLVTGGADANVIVLGVGI